MIITEIYKGQGLGNQLACYVTTRVIAKDKGYEFGIQCPERFKCLDFMNLDLGKQVFGGNGPEGGPPHTLPKGIENYYKERTWTHPISKADISTYDKNLITIPDNTKIDGNMQDEQYILHRKNEIREWLKVKDIDDCYDFADDDICIINFRGGEYVGLKNVFLPQEYWNNAVDSMLKINSNFKFVVITDDAYTAKKFFPEFDVFHFSISKDYTIIKNAHYLILSNSSFAWFPAWLNEKLKFCIAPKYWWAHNISDGFWACDYNITTGWWYQDKDGKLQDYNTCLEELLEYKKNHYQYYPKDIVYNFLPVHIKDNFLVISNYNNDIDWIPKYSDKYIIYDRSDKNNFFIYKKSNKIIKSPNIGYNLYDYFTFIIDNYHNLPNCIIFTKSNIFPRHVYKHYFDKVVNNNFFTPLADPTIHKTHKPINFFSNDGSYYEINNSWYTRDYQTKYFTNYNDFLNFCFYDPVIPKYVRFAPGGNYIVPKHHILKLPKVFYENLRIFISHCQLPGEAHIIERALYTLWTCDFKIRDAMLYPLDENFVIHNSLKINDALSSIKKYIPQQAKIKITRLFQNIKINIKRFKSLRNIEKSMYDLSQYIKKITTPQHNLSITEIEIYRKKIKIYDIFYFFNEVDLLEIRLNILDKYVDYFIIIEATETFSGIPKKLFYEENKQKFKKFSHKIIHYIIRDTPLNEDDLRKRLYDNDISALDKEIIINTLTSDNIPKGQTHWMKEFYQKECAKKALLHLNLSDNDICFVSDVDEIWNPNAIIDYTKDDIFKYKQTAYFYYLNNRSNDDWRTGWTGTVTTKYKNIKKSCLNHLRTTSKNTYTVIKDGGWHFTFQGGAERIKKKLESYGHQEFNTEVIKSNIENILTNNKDYRGRRLKFWIDEQHLPKYIKENKNTYKNLFK